MLHHNSVHHFLYNMKTATVFKVFKWHKFDHSFCYYKCKPANLYSYNRHGAEGVLGLFSFNSLAPGHNSDVMSAMASQITGVSIVYSTVCSDADQRKHQISASLAFVRGIHRWPVNSPHKEPVTRKMFPFDDVIMRDAAVILIQYMIIRYLEHSMWNWPQTNATRPRR